MREFLEVALLPVNLFYTFLLLFMLVYWLSVIFGALDVHFLDFDLDADLDADLDLDADVDAHIGGGWLAGTLQFFNIGRVPFMTILTVVILNSWILMLLGNYYLGQNSWWFFAAAFIPVLFVSLLIAKLITTPLIPVFDRLNTAAEPVVYLGREGRLRLPASYEMFGQMEVVIDDSSFLLSVRTTGPETTIPSGTDVRIVDRLENGQFVIEKC
jgi:hypothetical protein